MSEMKARSIRAEQSTLDKFKEISEDFENQGAALESLIQAYEIQNAKAVLTTRQTDVEDFDTHLQAIQSAFLHSLEIAENAEERIRLEFKSSLESKDKTISSLQERLELSDRLSSENLSKVHDLEETVRIFDSKLSSAIHAQQNAETALNDKQVIIDNLSKQLSEAITLLEGVDNLKEREESLKADLLSAQEKIKDLEQSAQLAAERAENAKEKAVLEAERSAVKEMNILRDTIMKQSETINDLKLQISSLQSQLGDKPVKPKTSSSNKSKNSAQ